MRNFSTVFRWFGIPLSLLFAICQHGCTNRQSSEMFGHKNAIWSESIYLRGYNPTSYKELNDEDIKLYAKRLKSHSIRYAYLFAGPFDGRGHLPSYAFSDTAINTVKLLRRYNPDLIILPWIGGLQNKTVHLEDSIWVSNAVSSTKRLIEKLNVPGVHVDLEYLLLSSLDNQVHNEISPPEVYGNNVNKFHRRLREELPKAFISSVVVATSPDTKPWKRKTTLTELKELTKHVDQLSFLFFDTSIKDQKQYEYNCDKLINDIEALKALRSIEYLIAIGSFINGSREVQEYRDMEIENIPNTLETIKNVISSRKNSRQTISGIALYCDWQTDENEWNQFKDNWP